ncbi:MAG TPA: hypothetical protein VK858_05280, partial [Longimicrobiales bacterium]|nr:hypothetical protein [Longimicrobiales bacterium]
QWSPDGRSIALSSEVGEDAGELGPAAAWIPELGGPTEQLVFSPGAGAWDFPTSWTPDGRSIVVTMRREGASADIALFDLEGDRELVPLVGTPANEFGGRVSPDGRWLAYVSDQSGRREVWVRPFTGRGSPVQISGNGGTEPVWARDSEELFFRSASEMMVVQVPQDPASDFGVPTALFPDSFQRNLFGGNSANFDVSGDGERFLVVRRRDRVQPTVIDVILNWVSVLGPPDPTADGQVRR